jgi:NADPH-dependent 2,4-dienoyl-CoA reductase/sulfur reductase-like enzyme
VDFVVMGVGVRPRVGLARAAGLTVDDGIVVDAVLRTSDGAVWAAGDVARFPDPLTGEHIRIEHWVVAGRMGAGAARSVLGVDDPKESVPFFWSQHYDAVISYVGHAKEWDALQLDGDPAARDCAVRFTKRGRLLALATIFRDASSLATEIELERTKSRG